MAKYLAFLRNRMFRSTLLGRQGLSIDRLISPDRLRTLHVASSLTSDDISSSMMTDRSPVIFRPPVTPSAAAIWQMPFLPSCEMGRYDVNHCMGGY